MDKVYIVFAGEHYASHNLVSVHATEEAALAAAKNYMETDEVIFKDAGIKAHEYKPGRGERVGHGEDLRVRVVGPTTAIDLAETSVLDDELAVDLDVFHGSTLPRLGLTLHRDRCRFQATECVSIVT